VRQVFAQTGLDPDHFQGPDWNPLRQWIKPGSRVFILCNFVLHRSPDESIECFHTKCLHASVLRAVVDYVLLALKGTGSVAFGNSPMQACDWDAVLRETGTAKMMEFYAMNGVPVNARDLRFFVLRSNSLGFVRSTERRPKDDEVAVDLGGESYFAELDCVSPPKYRVMNYSRRRMESCHQAGSHVYVINRNLLESDVVISLPKFKTHEKVGLTCALKGFVGSVGHKDSLPHHRFGPPEKGGDEYPRDKGGILWKTSAFHDWVQMMAPDTRRGGLARVLDKVIRAVLNRWAPIREGAWWGNDTAWRMVLDLARIATYASFSGALQDKPQRTHLVLVDGIIGGEGGGPLFPTPVPTGLLLFSDGLLATDIAVAHLMGFDPQQMPFLREAQRSLRYSLPSPDWTTESMIYNGKPVALRELSSLLQRPFNPPPGWVGHLGPVCRG